LAGSSIGCPCHVCALFDSRDDEYRFLTPYTLEAIQQGERALHFVDSRHRSELLRELSNGGVDVESAQRSGQLEIDVWENVYLRQGNFRHRDVLDLVQEAIIVGRDRGFSRSRVWGNMGWTLEKAPGVEELAEYECRLNYFLPLYREAVVCAYDVSLFSAAVLY
jgi:hypothetical protein